MSPGIVSREGLRGLKLEDIKGKSLLDLGDLLVDELIFLYDRCNLRSKSQPLGEGSQSLFPLPLSAVREPGSSKGSFVRAMCAGLNLLYGGPVDEKGECVTACKAKGVELLEKAAQEIEETRRFFRRCFV